MPDLIITAATGGGGAITRIGTTASRVTNTARRLLTTARRLPDFNNIAAITRARTGLTNARHLANTTLDDIATTLFPQTGLSPAWADNISYASRLDDLPTRTQWPQGGPLPKRIPEGIARQRLSRDLSEWRQVNLSIGDNIISITRERMMHFLERHHPNYFWDAKPRQSFFPENWTVQDVENTIRELLRRNHDEIASHDMSTALKMEGNFNGRDYVLTIANGEVVQFYLK